MLEQKSPTTGASAVKNDGNKGSDFQQDTQVKSDVFTASPDTSFVTDAPERPLRIMPIDGFRQLIQDIIEEYTDALGAQRDFVTSPVLTAGATGAGNNMLFQTNSFVNTAVLWLLLISGSGRGKSEPMSQILSVFDAYDRYNYEQYLDKHQEWEDNGCKGKEPVSKQIVISDATQEARNDVFWNNSIRSLLYVDEINVWFEGMGRYSGKSNELSESLTIWSRKPLRINRKGEKIKYKRIEEPFMPITGTIQSYVLPETFGLRKLMVNGFNFRWLFVFPEIVRNKNHKDRPVNPELKSKWYQVVKNIMDYCNNERHILRLSDVASERYNRFKVWNNERADKYEDEGNYYLSEACRKFDVHALRLALAVQALNIGAYIVENNEPPKNADIIDDATMEYALRLCDYFFETAKEVYNLIISDKEPQKIGHERLWAMLRDEYGLEGTAAEAKGLAEAVGIAEATIRKAWKRHPKKGESSK